MDTSNERKRGHSSTATLDVRIRRLWRLHHAVQENTSPTRLSGRKTSIGARSPLPTTSFPLDMSTCGEVGSDVYALIKELAIRPLEHRSEIHPNESRHLAEGIEVTRLRRQLSFVLQQALSFRTRHHLCRQGVPTAPFATPGVCTRGPCNCTEGRKAVKGNGGGCGQERTNARREWEWERGWKRGQ